LPQHPVSHILIGVVNTILGWNLQARVCIKTLTLFSDRLWGNMSRARYLRGQAQVLLAWAQATKDSAYAALLTTRAMEMLAKANEANDDRIANVDQPFDSGART
jgi:hypothetical protein